MFRSFKFGEMKNDYKDWYGSASRGIFVLQSGLPANTKHLYNICITSAQRLTTLEQHCTNVIQMFCVFWAIFSKAKSSRRCKTLLGVNLARHEYPIKRTQSRETFPVLVKSQRVTSGRQI